MNHAAEIAELKAREKERMREAWNESLKQQRSVHFEDFESWYSRLNK